MRTVDEAEIASPTSRPPTVKGQNLMQLSKSS